MRYNYEEWLKNGCPKIFCKCGCEQEIIVKKRPHKYDGIPEYISGHNSRGRLQSEETKRKRSLKFMGNKLNLGVKFSDDHKRKISESLKNKPKSEEHKQKMRKPKSKEAIQKMKDNHPDYSGKNNPNYGNHKLKGENNPMYGKEGRMKGKFGDKSSNWKGGISKLPYCEKWTEELREEIREQYNSQCYICGRKEKDNLTRTGKLWKLSVHHIDNDKEQGCNGKPWKLAPLCLHCHNSKKMKKLKV